jgi:hypothetical protein
MSLNLLTLEQEIYRRDAVFRRPEWEYDTKLARYRDPATGRFLSQKDALLLTRKAVATATERLAALTDQLGQGLIRLDQWQRSFAGLIKTIHLAQFILGRGGVKNVFPADFLEIARTLKAQYRFLDQFAKDIAGNRLTLNQIRARANLYINASVASFWRAQAQAQAVGPQPGEMRRLLAPVEHCAECLAYAAAGWVPVGTLPMPTERCSCRANCKCTVEYR